MISSRPDNQDGGPPPCSEKRRGGEKPGKEEPGGKEDGDHSSFFSRPSLLFQFLELRHSAVTSVSRSFGQKPYTGN